MPAATVALVAVVDEDEAPGDPVAAVGIDGQRGGRRPAGRCRCRCRPARRPAPDASVVDVEPAADVGRPGPGSTRVVCLTRNRSPAPSGRSPNQHTVASSSVATSAGSSAAASRSPRETSMSSARRDRHGQPDRRPRRGDRRRSRPRSTVAALPRRAARPPRRRGAAARRSPCRRRCGRRPGGAAPTGRAVGPRRRRWVPWRRPAAGRRRLERLQHRRPLVPGAAVEPVDHVVAVQGGDRDHRARGHAEPPGQGGHLVDHGVVGGLRPSRSGPSCWRTPRAGARRAGRRCSSGAGSARAGPSSRRPRRGPGRRWTRPWPCSACTARGRGSRR